jgi:beta-xylosidase
MPIVPPWVGPGFTWAPDVRRVGDTYVLWFTAAAKHLTFGARGHPVMCIGVATSASPLGPFVSNATEPAICQVGHHGSIDARTFLDDDGRLWVHWKSDDNAEPDGGPPTIYAQRLAPDGVTLTGRPTELLTVDQPWEGTIVEAPQMIVAGGRHWLFYSANWFNQDVYGVGLASCAGPAGPCVKPSAAPWLASNRQGRGPGEASLFEDDDGLWIAYSPNQAFARARPVAIAHVEVIDGVPQLTRQRGRA